MKKGSITKAALEATKKHARLIGDLLGELRAKERIKQRERKKR
jgi:hypothetical protein